MKQENKKERNYKAGAVKRLLGIRRDEKVGTGTFIKKRNELMATPKKRTATMGLV